MVAPGDAVLVAISGGSDSTALLHALAQLRSCLGIRLCAAHIHHGIRGREADADARAAEELAAGIHVPFSLRRVDVPAHARKYSLSLETAARELRYAALEAIAKRRRANHIATGHTLDDQAETVLLNVLRGAGPRGLAGIPPVRGAIIRPLIETKRVEAQQYCETQGLRYRVDRSNADLRHTRNRIRHEIIPALQRVQPAVASQLANLALIMRAEDEVMDWLADSVLCEIEAETEEGISIPRGGFVELPTAIQRRVIRKAIAKLKGDELDLEFERVDAVVHLALFGRTGAVVELPVGLFAKRGYREILIGCPTQTADSTVSHHTPAIWELTVPGKISISEFGVSISARHSRSRKLPSDPHIALVDADTLKLPLIVRTRRPGDRFRPTGMQAPTKLQDFFVNAKVPRADRDRIPLVVSEKEIIWVAGYRVSDIAKVTERTRRTVRLEVKPS